MFTGYSSLCNAMPAEEGADRLRPMTLDPHRAPVLQDAGQESKIEFRLGPGPTP